MKVKLPDTPYEFISDNTQDVNAQTALLETTQNSRYIDDEVRNSAHSVVSVQDVKTFFWSGSN